MDGYEIDEKLERYVRELYKTIAYIVELKFR